MASKRKRETESLEDENSLKSEEISFPRGGGSLLTPLEIKQATNEASKELFADESTNSVKSKKIEPVKKKKKVVQSEKEANIRIESVNSHLVKSYGGTTVLSQIIRVEKTHLVVGLPNTLIGEISAANISEPISNVLSKSEDNDGDDESEETVFKGLQSYGFQPGQWLRVSATENANSKGLSLTCEPLEVNDTISQEDLTSGMLVQGYIKSIEDKGAIVEVGKDKTGFISNDEYPAEKLVVGQVRLFEILSNSRTLLLADASLSKKKKKIDNLDSVDSLISGSLVDLLVTEVEEDGIVGKIFGSIDATLDYLHSGFAFSYEKPKIGDKIQTRVLYSQGKRGFNVDETVQSVIILSRLVNVLNLDMNQGNSNAFKTGQILPDVKVSQIRSKLGVYVTSAEKTGFVHISRLSDNHVDSAHDIAPIGSLHQARVLDYSPIDNLFIMAFAPRIVDQRYINMKDIPAGETFRGVITGYTKDRGLFINLYNYNDNDNMDEAEKKDRFKRATQGEIKDVTRLRGVAGPLHITDVKLKNPELKYKLNSTVKCRVLNITQSGSLQLTVKKSLVNSDDKVYESWNDLNVGTKLPGTIVKIKPSGAIIEFFGGITAFLPLSEMSEALIDHPDKLFSLGQTVRVTILKKQDEPRRMTVTCRSSSTLETSNESMNDVVEGKTVLEGKVIGKSVSGLTLEFADTNVIGTLSKEHLDDSVQESSKKFKLVVIGQTMKVLVLQKHLNRRLVKVTAKSKLIAEARNGGMLTTFQDVVDNGLDKKRFGFITNVTPKGLFVGFAGRLSGLILKSEFDKKTEKLCTSSNIFQTVEVRICMIDEENKRFLLSTQEKKVDQSSKKREVSGDKVKISVLSVKRNQLNVEILNSAYITHGRVDISEVYDKIEDIEDVKHPLKRFTKNQKLQAKVLGYHEIRSHRFLPISHRSNGDRVFELSLRPSYMKNDKKPLLSDSDLTVGGTYLAFINNTDSSGVFVNISPSVRGRISKLEMIDDISKLESFATSFPIGMALSTTVKSIAPLRLAVEGFAKSWESFKVGQLVPAVVVKTKPDGVTVRLADEIFGTAYLTDLADTYGPKISKTFKPDELIVAKILDIDASNKKINVTLRKSETTDSEVDIKDPVIRKRPEVGAVVRGFVRSVSDAGLFIGLSSSITARAQIKNLSDDFLSDWKKFFSVGQLVEGKVLSVNGKGHIELSLKNSAIKGITLKGLKDIHVGELFSGNIKAVEEFGVFVRLKPKGFENLTGLCHKSEVADIPLQNLSKVFSVGEKVRVKTLKVDLEKGTLSLGMKASYFKDADNSDYDMEDTLDSKVFNEVDESDDEEEGGESDEESDDAGESRESADTSAEEDEKNGKAPASTGLSVGFDWTAAILDQIDSTIDSEEEESDEEGKPRKKRRKGPISVEDKTATLTTKLPQSVSDFERLLMGSPNSSVIWMNYMAFQLQLSEIDKAREIGQRALKTIGLRHEDEKLNIWVALLNLENGFGTPEAVEKTFKESLSYMDPKEMYVKMATIYADSDNIDEAINVFSVACKKFAREDPSLWVKYGQMLYRSNLAEKARELLDSVLKTTRKFPTVHRIQRDIISKFAIMEFNSEHGDPERGRTLFEGLVSSYPKRIDLWNIYIDQEIKAGNPKYVRPLIDRVITNVRLSQKQAKFFFKKWLIYETQHGDSKSQDYVKAKAAEYVNIQRGVRR